MLVAVTKAAPAARRWEDGELVAARQASAAARNARWEVANAIKIREAENVAVSALASLDSSLLHAETQPDAAAKLGAFISEAADSADLNLGTLELRDDLRSTPGLWRVGVRANLRGDLESLATFLAILEKGAKLIAVRELSVVQPDPALPDEKPETLQIEIAVEALAIPTRRGGT